MTPNSLWPRLSGTLTNAYNVYYSSCDLVHYSERVHRFFSVIDMINCLDFFPAIGRLKTAWTRFLEEQKLHPLCTVISEAAGMFSDVYWFVDELKSWKIAPTSAFTWAKPVYTIVSPFQYLWLIDSIKLSRTSSSIWTRDSVTTLTSVCYYSLSAIQYVAPQSRALSVLLVACSVSSLALGIFF